ncbi:hypothetical protein HPB50_029528 [Hyalomma asiaticum]|nr:hypothetical protein HPB50_029528 [Hyalomma asiaticum]
MDLSKLRKPDLVMLCEEMGIEVATLRRKPLLIQALEDSGADEEELSECWELIQERMKRESEDKEREIVRRKEEAEIQIREIERLRLQLQIVEAKCASSGRSKDYERTFQEFAFNMKADLVEWLKGEGVYEDRDKVVDLICLEQFYGSIDEEMRLWIQDRPGERNIERAAELADEYTLRRQSEKARVRPFSKQPLKDLPERKGPIAARELAAERAGEGEQPRAVDPCEQASTSAGEDGSSVTPTGTHNGHFREQRHCSPFLTSSGGGRAVITGKGRTAASRSCAVGVPHGRERSPVRCLERSSRCCRTQSASSDGRGTGGAFPTSYKKEGVGSARVVGFSDFWPTGGGASGPSDVE